MSEELITEQPISPEPAAPEPVREPFWGYIDLLLFIGLAVAFTVVFMVATALLLPHKTAPQMAVLNIVATAEVYAAVYLAWLIDFRTRYNRPVFSSLGWRPSTFRYSAAALGGVALALAVGLLMKLLNAPEVKNPVEEMVTNRTTLVIVALLAAVGAPIFEEAFFRGFLQPLLSRTLGAAAGIGITAILFGLLHTTEYHNQWQYPLTITLVGVVFGWVRYRSKSLIPSTIMHACFNGVEVVALFASEYSKLK